MMNVSLCASNDSFNHFTNRIDFQAEWFSAVSAMVGFGVMLENWK